MLTSVGVFQCDQMATVAVQYLDIFNNENMPNSIDIFQTMLLYFA